MPKPVLQAMVLADHIYQDRITGKHVIAGTFTTIIFGKPQVQEAEKSEDSKSAQVVPGHHVSQVGSPYLYIALVEVLGEVPLNLKFIDLSDASVLIEAKMSVRAHDPVSVAEYIVPMPPLPINKVGNYSLDLLHDGEILGSWRISVIEAPDQTAQTEDE